MEIALEMHSVWNLPSAIRIAKAVEPYDPMWFEDPVRMDNLDALAQFKASTRVPTTASETLSTRYAFREMLEKRAVSIVMLDCGWVGGLSEAKKIATMAEAYHLPVAPHDCTGPVTYVADVHLDFADHQLLHPGDGAGLHPRLVLPPGDRPARASRGGTSTPRRARGWGCP